ncbi:MAG: DUF3494 domain-containing protein [Planctomycetes bacterium]|nr:DUF3494 domain-containing protein [Planctomycetota bacterium]
MSFFCLPSVTAQVSLGSAQNFGVLGASTVTNTGPTIVSGDLGVSPGLALTGFPPGIIVGAFHAGNGVALQAQADANTAYNDFAGMACNFNLTGQDLGGLTLIPGVYCFSSSAQLTGTLVLDALGDPGSVFVFQIGSTLTTSSNANVRVINGGTLCNVFWQVGSSATLGTDTTFVGTILALASVTLTTGTDVNGRVFALNGAVTMDSNLVTVAPECRCTVQATVTDLGPGCGVPAAPILTSTVLIVGRTMVVSISSAFPAAMVTLFLSECGATPWTVPGTSCTVYLDPATLLPLLSDMTDAAGNWTFSFAIPLDHVLVGQCFVLQGLVWASGGPLAGDHLSNGLQVVIGCM